MQLDTLTNQVLAMVAHVAHTKQHHLHLTYLINTTANQGPHKIHLPVHPLWDGSGCFVNNKFYLTKQQPLVLP